MNKEHFAQVREKLEGFFRLLGQEAKIEGEEADRYLVCRVTTSGGSFMREGEEMSMINSLQYVVNRSLDGENDERRPRIVLDVNGCRMRREERLAELAAELAAEVQQTGEEKVLEPLDPRERRVIHLVIAKQDGVETHSVGDDYLKNVVIFKAGEEPPVEAGA